MSRFLAAAALACALAVLVSPSAAAAPGDLDTSFGSGGTVTTGPGLAARAIALQADGRILAAGDLNGDFAVARYLVDGALDVSFGSGGVAADDLGGFDAANTVAVQADGKIVAAGLSWAGTQQVFAVVRHLANGSVDTGFGSEGVVRIGFGGGDQAWKVLVQPDGKLLIVGSTGWQRFALARLLPDGSLDTSFGTGGRVTTAFAAGAATGSGAALQADGRILVSGSIAGDFGIARYLPDGAPDTSFGVGGVVVTDLGSPSDGATEVALQPDGQVVAAGYSFVSGGVFALARYGPDGVLDPTFGAGGVSETAFAFPALGEGLALAPDGSLFVSGDATVGGQSQFALARYTTAGALDLGFGSEGMVTTGFGAGTDANGMDVALQPDGRVVVGGLAWTTSGWISSIALARYEGAVDPLGQLRDLLAAVRDVGPGASLAAKVAAAVDAVGVDQRAGACDLLVGFDHEIAAQTGKSIAAETAAELRTAASNARTALGCV